MRAKAIVIADAVSGLGSIVGPYLVAVSIVCNKSSSLDKKTGEGEEDRARERLLGGVGTAERGG